MIMDQNEAYNRQTLGTLPRQAPYDLRGAQGAQCPKEPSMLGRATELLNHVATAELHSASLRSALFGEGECDGIHPQIPTSLDGLLKDACTRVASLCGELATIKSRLGCSPE